MSEKLSMSFDPRTIEHLGIKMYSTLPPAIAELIANSYDACANEVVVQLIDNDTDKQIQVIDNGTGMTFTEVNDYFLRIGRNRRQDNQKPDCKRFPTGKKGLGKLALFGIGKKIEVITCKNGKKTRFVMDWDEIISTEGEYNPDFDTSKCNESGTTIIVHNLKRKSDFDLKGLAISIAKLFNFNDDNFTIKVVLNGADEIIVDRELKFDNINKEFEWVLPATIGNMMKDEEFSYKEKLSGLLFTSEKPLPPGLRGITLYADGRMVNLPEFFGVSESSHFFSYLSGYIDVDFVDRWEEDVISTDRQSLDWDNERLSSLRAFLQRLILAISKDWRKRRKEKNREKTKEKTKVDTEEWLSKTPIDVKEKLTEIINTVTDEESELSSERQAKVIETMHELIPEYPNYHWRHLHEAIHRVSRDDYIKGDYFRAAEDAVKEYENIVKEISGLTSEIGTSLMNKSFGKECNKKPINITGCKTPTHENIEEGQRNLSSGLISGFRNPVSHEPKTDIHPSIFSDKDCLDILSLVSYLLGKLDQRVKPPLSDVQETET